MKNIGIYLAAIVPLFVYADTKLPLSVVDDLVEWHALDYTDWVKHSQVQYSAQIYKEPVTQRYSVTDEMVAISFESDSYSNFKYMTMDLASQCYRVATTTIKNGWGDWNTESTGDAKLVSDLISKLESDTLNQKESVTFSNGKLILDKVGRKYSCVFKYK